MFRLIINYYLIVGSVGIIYYLYKVFLFCLISFYGGKLKNKQNNIIFNPLQTLSLMVHTQQAQMQLDELKHGVIGLFKSRNSNVFELVTDVNDNNTIDVIRITQFGVIQKEHNLPIHYGTLKLFPDDMNMFEMLDNPFDWNDFINSFPAKNK